MDTIHILLFSILALAIIGLIIAVSYHMKHKNPNNRIASVSYTDDQSGNKSPGAGGIILVIVILLFVIGISIISIWLTLKRYQIAGNAIKQGNTGIALAALSPEIGQGISDIIH